jgi:predicted O-methyltransferase YrrM
MRNYNQAPKQAVALGGLIEKEKLTNGVELGVFWGETTFYLMDKFPNLRLVGIDLWEPVVWGDKNDDGYRTYEQFPLNQYYEDVKEKTKKYPNLVIIKSDTVKAAELFSDNYFDFVFIDADHTYDGVKRDIEAWLPKVTKFVVGHDIHMDGVRKAVIERFGTYTELDNFVWYIRL